MPLVSAEQLVRSLAVQSDLHILSRAPAYEIHRNDRRSGDGLLETGHNLGKRSLECPLVDFDGGMFGAESGGRFRGIRQFIVFKAFAVPDRKRRPLASSFVHQS